jgi:hypothetical protein
MKKLLLLLFLLSVSCSKETVLSPNELINTKGTIQLYVCSRGCAQYLLQADQQLWMPDSLPPAIKKLPNGSGVIFSGVLQADSANVYRPAPDDSPLFDFKARKIKLTQIRQQ